MADTVKMRAVLWHTYDGVAREPGAEYDADPAYVETLTTLGMATPADAPAAAPADMSPPDPPAAVATPPPPAAEPPKRRR